MSGFLNGGSATGAAGGDLSGSYPSPTVVGIQGEAVPTPSGTNTVLLWNGTTLSWSTVSGGSFTAGGDLTGTSSAQYVQSLSGASDTGGIITINATTLQYAKGQSSPNIVQAAQTTDTAVSSLTVKAQSAFATATTNITGANLVLQAGSGATGNATFTSGNVVLEINAPNSGGTEAYVQVNRAGTELIQLGALVGTTSQGAIYLGTFTPGSANYQLSATSNGGTTILNGANSTEIDIGGSIKCLVSTNGFTFFNSSTALNGGGTGVIGMGNASVNPTSFPSGGLVLYSTAQELGIDGYGIQFSNFVPTGVSINQAAQTSDIATTSLTIQSQAPYSGATSNKIPGNIIFNTPSPISGGTVGNIQFQNGGTEYVQISNIAPPITGLTTLAGAVFQGIGGTGGMYFANSGNTAGFGIYNGSSVFYINAAMQLQNAQTQYAASVSLPTLSQATPTSDTATTPLTIQSQAPYASAVTNLTPGDIILNTPAPISTGATGAVEIQSGGTKYVQIGQYQNSSTSGAIWMGNLTRSNSNYTIISNNTTTDINSAQTTNLTFNGGIYTTVNSSTWQYNQPTLEWFAAITTPTLTQITPTSDTTPSAMTVKAQSAFATASTNTTGANLVLQAGVGATSNATFISGNVIAEVNAPNSGGTEAYFQVSRAGTTMMQIGAVVGTVADGALYAGVNTPSSSNYMLYGTSTNIHLNAPSSGTISLDIGGSQQVSIIGGTISMTAITTLAFPNTISAPVFDQTGKTSDAATANLTIQAQNAFATASTNTTGGSLILQAGAGATSNATFISGNVIANVLAPNSGGTEAYFEVQRAGTTMLSLGALVGTTGTGAIYPSSTIPSASNYVLYGNSTNAAVNAPGAGSVSLNVQNSTIIRAASNLVSISQSVGGLSGGNAFNWEATSQALTTGTIALANTVYNSPRIKFTGTLTGNVIVQFPATEGAFWIVDFEGVTFSSNTVTLQANGNSWGTVISTANTNTGDVFHITYNGAFGKLFGTTMTP